MKFICSLCKKPCLADPRNRHHQKVCSRKACQRARRNQSQQERRAKTKVNGRRSSEAVIEAVLTLKHPLIYGLVSMWLGSHDKNDIEAVIRRLLATGRDILNPPTVTNSAATNAQNLIPLIQSPSIRDFQTAAFPPRSRRR